MRIRATLLVPILLGVAMICAGLYGLFAATDSSSKSLCAVGALTVLAVITFALCNQPFAEVRLENVRLESGQEADITLRKSTLQNGETLHLYVRKTDWRLSAKEYLTEREDVFVAIYQDEILWQELTIAFWTATGTGRDGHFTNDRERFLPLKSVLRGHAETITVHVFSPYHDIEFRVLSGISIVEYFHRLKQPLMPTTNATPKP